MKETHCMITRHLRCNDVTTMNNNIITSFFVLNIIVAVILQL